MVALGGYTPATLLSAPKGERLLIDLKAQGRSVRLLKQRGESVQHLLMKALLWAALLPSYPLAECEIDVGHRYKPDVVELGSEGEPNCWGECGAVATSKLAHLAAEFPRTHFIVSKWAHSDIRGYAETLRRELALPPRAAAFEVTPLLMAPLPLLRVAAGYRWSRYRTTVRTNLSQATAR